MAGPIAIRTGYEVVRLVFENTGNASCASQTDGEIPSG